MESGGKTIKNPKNYKLRITLIFFIIVSIVAGIIYIKMQPVIMNYSRSVAETIMLNSADEAIIKVLESENITYNDIARLTNNTDGYVTSLEIDVYEVNRLKGKISNEVSRLVDSREFYSVGIPLGTFFCNTYTQGLGPKLKFNMQLTSTAFVTFSHEFKSAGINQVLHIINVDIEINGSFVIAGYNRSISVKTSAIAAQTVIVGKTPDAFTNVVESAYDNTGGLINDYGALVE